MCSEIHGVLRLLDQEVRMGKPELMNDELLDLLGKLFLELKLAMLMQISFADFIADYEEYLFTAAWLYVGSDSHSDSIREGADEESGYGSGLRLDQTIELQGSMYRKGQDGGQPWEVA
jgi:hypothetical protein